jgi:hypothetical protein
MPPNAGQNSTAVASRFSIAPNVFGKIALQYKKINIIISLLVRSIANNGPLEKIRIKSQYELLLSEIIL